MEILQLHRAEMIGMAVALVAIGASTTFYFYITKKPKGIYFFVFWYLGFCYFFLLFMKFEASLFFSFSFCGV